MKIDKSTGVPALLAGLVSFCTLLGIMWLVLRPAVSTAVASDLKDDIQKTVKDTVEQEIKPMKTAVEAQLTAFEVIIQDRILSLRKEIALLQRKQVSEGLTVEETTRMVDLEAQLSAQEKALRGLQQ